MFKKIILFWLFLLSYNLFFAQDRKLADEYFSNSEYQKAAIHYEKIYLDVAQFNEVYPKYLQCLVFLQEYEKALDLTKRAQKTDKLNYSFKVDYGVILTKIEGQEKADKYFEKLIDELPENPFYANQVANAFIKNILLSWAEKTYLLIREKTKTSSLFFFELSNIYRVQNDKEKLSNHLLYGLDNGFASIFDVENMMQSIFEEKDYQKLELTLLKRVQDSPKDLSSIELLIWLYYQLQDFESALMQSKPFDIKANNFGEKTYEVGEISLKNKDYKTATAAFEFIIANFKGGNFYMSARKKIISAREAMVKNVYPIDSVQINLLLNDYSKVLDEFGRIYTNADVFKQMAILYAFYLGNNDKAIELLNELNTIKNADKTILAEAKLILGDIYTLKNEPWESILIYGQVEKENKMTSIAHEAKLKTAKLSYYIGEFELAKSHLDILKEATTKEISNDAIELSVFIEDNSGLDTTFDALLLFAQTELLVFQNKFDEALIKMNSILKEYPNHSLTDEIYFKKAIILQKQGKFTEAIAELEKISTDYSTDILADDALLKMGEIYELNLKDLEKAKECYKQILLTQQGSTLVNEARRRFRTLRGDFN